MSARVLDHAELEEICGSLEGKHFFTQRSRTLIPFENFRSLEAVETKYEGEYTREVLVIFGLKEGELAWIRESPYIWMNDDDRLTNGTHVEHAHVHPWTLDYVQTYSFTENVDNSDLMHVLLDDDEQQVRKIMQKNNWREGDVVETPDGLMLVTLISTVPSIFRDEIFSSAEVATYNFDVSTAIPCWSLY